ncbi:ATP synthase F1 subunit delta [Gluconobacter kondonii]|uniref:ATP synthase F1 subunit delta n=1 Tax=Gluconobacter kondonii TaxID=941463 RepID=UPI001B8D8345|nr:ATP synthase F1 subunit delta [Gluconobacter kondonii]MBS1080778.1 ATP synthase F1 subunit delta [Gluconobacter kondonii]MBS1083884.1 ATP synthase F1 subunit delta [Gluconobacter kondonii]
MTVTQVPQVGQTGGLAQRYARALYDLASEQGNLPDVLGEVKALRTAISESDDLRKFLADARLDIRQGQTVSNVLMSKLGFGDVLRRFVGVIAENRRLPDLASILDGVLALDAALRGEVVAEVRSAQPLNDTQRSQLQARLAEAGYSRVSMTEHTDATLLGGMTVRIGSTLFDTSIAGRLTRLQNAMKGAA